MSVDGPPDQDRFMQRFVVLSALMDDPCEQVYGPLDQGQGSVECRWLNVALRDDPHELADYLCYPRLRGGSISP